MTKNKEEEIPLIYIASNGRSGSTLLDLLLGSFDNAWTMGEVNVLPWELREDRNKCGCGKITLDCPFWGPIVRDLEGILDTKGKINLFREYHGAGKVLRLKELFRLLFRKSFPQEKLAQFCRDNEKLFSVVKEKAQLRKNKEIKYLVDASKDLYRLFWLTACDKFNVKAIHIIKDPRGFIYSINKDETNWSFFRHFRSTVRMSIRYIVENLLIEIVGKKILKENFLIIRCEDLASRPEETLKRIAKWLNLPHQKEIASSFRSKENHGVAGSVIRHESRGIFLDEEWKTRLSPFRKIIITFLTYFWARRYGYFK